MRQESAASTPSCTQTRCAPQFFWRGIWRGMRRKILLSLMLGLLLVLGSGSAPLLAQTAHESSAAMAVPAGMESDDLLAEDMLALDGPETAERGFNASLALNGVYDQQLNWAVFMQPAVSYRFNSNFSADITIPYYFYRLAYKYKNGQPLNGPLTPHRSELGDTTLAGHAEFSMGRLEDTFTPEVNLPTGNTTYGLSTGRVTYEVLNDMETTLRRFTPDVQLGIGDSSDLINRKVLRNYDTLGTLAYFQAGGMEKVGSRVQIAGDLYEDLPIGSQKVYTQVIRTKRKKVIQRLTRSGGYTAEDNGLTLTLDLPPKRHVEFSSYFNRSFRLADSTVGFALTFWAKNP